MSYSATICFKTLKEGEVYAFLKKIKDICKEKFDEIAEENFIFMPSVNCGRKRLYEGASDMVKEEADRAWMRNSIFTYRFFYLPEHNLLGVFSIPKALQDIFDLTCYFQNSCDQDYDFNEWKGIPIFEQIAEKWNNATDEEVYKSFEYPDEHEEPIDYDYYRRSNAYNEIWRMCSAFLYDESEVVYISIFGGYEIGEQIGFVKKCHEAYNEWEKQFEKECATEKGGVE